MTSLKILKLRNVVSTVFKRLLNSSKAVSSPCQGSCSAGPSCDIKPDEICKTEACMVDPCKPTPQVVIVGAGMSGLSAAHRLVKCGIKTITVLEALDRPGGRIHSCWMGDVVAEMGAQTICGASVVNPIYTLAAQEGLISNPLVRPSFDRTLFCTSDGRGINYALSIMASHSFKGIVKEACSLHCLGSVRQHGNLLHFIGTRIQQELHNYSEEQRQDASRVMYGLVNVMRAKCGTDLSLINADSFGSFVEIPGGNIRIPLGYVGVLAPLLRDLPECCVRYCKQVQNVRWGALGDCSPRAVVKCTDGEELPADYVIITVSLGVLKAKADNMFNPALPVEKMCAIDKIGHGCVNKIFLEYCRPFWVWREGNMKLAWTADELCNRDDWVKGICLIEEQPSSQHVLCVWIAGSEAEKMELCSDEEVADGITRVLRQFTGDPSLPYPNSILRSKWCTDHNFRGSFTYMGLDCGVGNLCDLGSPLPPSCDPVAPILLFAGDSTVPGHYGTVHGARLSGIREAERIVQLTKRYGGPPTQLGSS